MDRFISGLRSRSDDVRVRTARELKRYVTTELQEGGNEEYNTFFDKLNQGIFELVSSNEVHEKKGAILAIVSLIGLDDGNVTRVSRFANYLRNILPNSDIAVMEMGAKAIGRLALAESALTAEYVEFEVRRALEWLSQEKHEHKRHAAVLVLRELAVYSPTLFYQSVQQFFDNIYGAIRDPRPIIRERAVLALRACLRLMADRENKESLNHNYYHQTYEEALRGFGDGSSKDKSATLGRDDRVHGSLLIINELVSISAFSDETLRAEVTEEEEEPSVFQLDIVTEEKYPWQPPTLQSLLLSTAPSARTMPSLVCSSSGCRQLVASHFGEICVTVLKYKTSRNPLVQQVILTVLPRLAAFDSHTFGEHYLKDAMQFLLSSVKKEREKSASFKAIGLVSFAVKDKVHPYLNDIMNAIRQCLPTSRENSAVKGRPSRTYSQSEPSIFPCVSLLARSMGAGIKDELRSILDPMFQLGLSPGLTAALETIAKEMQLESEIQTGVLRILSHILMHDPLRHPGAPKPTPSSGSSLVTMETDVPLVTLALRTLGTFNFGRHPPMQFVVSCAQNYLTSADMETRLEAVKTCAALLVPMLQQVGLLGAPYPVISTASNQVVSDVLTQLLTVGITDPALLSLQC